MSLLAKIECFTPEIASEAVSLARSGHVVGTAAIDNAGQLGRLQGLVAGWIGDLTEDEQGAY